MPQQKQRLGGLRRRACHLAVAQQPRPPLQPLRGLPLPGQPTLLTPLRGLTAAHTWGREYTRPQTQGMCLQGKPHTRRKC